MPATPVQTPPPVAVEAWPAQVELIMSALEAGEHRTRNRRAKVRTPYRVRGRLRLFSDVADAQPWVLYTRDIGPRDLGFLSPHRLPLGYGGRIELPTADGETVSVHCTLYRCRECAPGWYEGSVTFNREQTGIAPEE